MDRLRLNTLTDEELQAEVIRYGLIPCPERHGLIDQIMTHLEQHGPLLDIRNNQPVRNMQTVGANSGLPSASTESDRFQILLEEMKKILLKKWINDTTQQM